jgi:chemotaxis protein methyltransferase CheR
VLGKASLGVYPQADLAGLPPARLALFEPGAAGTVQIPAAARALVSFLPLNLVDQWPMRGPFDAIFCRNVTIYFDKATQSEVFSRFRDLLPPGGFLYIGHSENIGAGATGYRLVGKTIYQARAAQKAKDAA